ncbi:MAG: hypothetical protein AAF193_10230, partial [Bacteroidota bacterium]
MLSFVLEAGAQSRFNVREASDFSGVTFKGVIEMESGYGVTCNGVHPTDSGSVIPISHVLFSQEGEYLSKNMTFLESGYNLITSISGFKDLNSGFGKCCIGYRSGSNSITEGFISGFSDSGLVLFTHYFESPYYSEVGSDSTAPIAFCSSTNDDNSIFISSSILNTEQGSTGGDFYIQRMTPNGDVLWEYIYATEAQPEFCRAILPTQDGGLLGILREIDLGEETSNGKLFELDSSGNLILLVDVPVPN